MPSKKYPDGWRELSNIGRVILGTKFIAFKVPLTSSSWNLRTLKSQAPGLKSIIDLTATTKYYQPIECEALGIKHKKILVPGTVVPPKQSVEQFFSAVEEFKDEDGLIGVHCTHGLNRSGYMICRYMIEKDGVDPDEAIERFNTARGHEQTRVNYLEHLRSKAWETDADDADETVEKMKNLDLNQH